MSYHTHVDYFDEEAAREKAAREKAAREKAVRQAMLDGHPSKIQLSDIECDESP